MIRSNEAANRSQIILGGASMIGITQHEGNLNTWLTSLILFFFLWANIQPTLAAVKQESEVPAQVRSKPSAEGVRVSPIAELEAELIGLQRTVQPERDRIIRTKKKDARTGKEYVDITIVGTPDEMPVKEHQQRLRMLAIALASEEQAVMQQFAADAAHIEGNKLPSVVRERHAKAVASYRTRSKDVRNRLSRLTQSTTVVALHDECQALLDELGEWFPKSSGLDPERLPFRPPTNRVREPLETPEALKGLLGSNATPSIVGNRDRTHVIGDEELASLDAQKAWYPIDRFGVEVASLTTTLLAEVAALVPPGPEYLASTEDVQITDEIRALAAQLQNDPLQIYNWVRNSVTYVPTWLSLQGSQRTLETMRGNAYDVSSLLIALYRAAGFPARYRYGVVRMPEEVVRNWVGGAASATQAMQALAQGGIPNRGLANGGVIKYIELEHVWVEAFLDFYPSRGAKNLAPDAWVPMDASFKQFKYSDELTASRISIPDRSAEFNQWWGRTNVDPATGAITGVYVDQGLAFMGTLQADIDEFYTLQEEQATEEEPEDGEFRTIQAVVASDRSDFAATLPYQFVRSLATWSAVPGAFRGVFDLEVFATQRDSELDAPLVSLRVPLTRLGGHPITIEFAPESQDDLDTMLSYYPPHQPGDPLDYTQVPDTLPGYLISMSGRITMGGQVLKTLGSFPLGTELYIRSSITDLQGGTHSDDGPVTVGTRYSITVSVQGASDRDLDVAEVPGVDSLLSEAGKMYWTLVDTSAQAYVESRLALMAPHPSFGALLTELRTLYSWGIPSRVAFGGVSVDMGLVKYGSVSRDESLIRSRDVQEQFGQMISAAEHEVPELYVLPFDAPKMGVSSMRVMEQAYRSNTPVYRVSSQNWAQIRPLLDHESLVMEDLEVAMAAGKVATVPQHAVNIGGTLWSGYITVDPETGAGAYRISRGLNGGGAEDERMDKSLGTLALGIGSFAVSVFTSIAKNATCFLKSKKFAAGKFARLLVRNVYVSIFRAVAPLILTFVPSAKDDPALHMALAVTSQLFILINAVAQMQGGCPTLFVGARSTRNKDTTQIRNHVASALRPDTNVLTYRGATLGMIIREEAAFSWPGNSANCTAAQRAASPGKNCDEYPFLSTFEGGPNNYGAPNNWVSLELVDRAQNSSQGGMLPWFYRRCTATNGLFRVVPTAGTWRGVRANGTLCFGR